MERVGCLDFWFTFREQEWADSTTGKSIPRCIARRNSCYFPLFHTLLSLRYLLHQKRRIVPPLESIQNATHSSKPINNAFAHSELDINLHFHKFNEIQILYISASQQTDLKKPGSFIFNRIFIRRGGLWLNMYPSPHLIWK